jgi:hypothetical protein
MTRSLITLVSLVAASLVFGKEDLPPEVQAGLVSAMEAKVTALIEQKDANGNSYMRGTFSRAFKKVDDNTYTTSMNRDTVTADRMKVERFLVTLIRKDGNSFEVSKEELQDTFDKLYRSPPRNEKFFAFQALNFDREGLKASSGPGFMYVDYVQDQPVAFRFTGSGLKYEYAPPEGVNQFQEAHVWRAVQKERTKLDDINFTPEFGHADCDDRLSCQQLLESFTGMSEIKLSELPPLLRTRYEDSLRELEKSRKDAPFSGFGLEAAPSQRYWTFFLRRFGQDRAFGIIFNSDEAWEVRIQDRMSYFAPPLFGYPSEETRKSGASIYDLEMEPDADSKDYEIEALKGTVELALEDPEAMAGDITYTINVKRDLPYLAFRISRLSFTDAEQKDTKNPNLIVNSVEDGEGRQLTWTRLGPFVGVITFPEPLKAGSQQVIRMDFKNQECIYNLNYSYSAMDRGGWLPLVRFGDMIDRFEMTIKVPSRYTVLGIGKRISDRVEGNIRISEWKANFPITFPTVIFGEYISKPPSVPLPKKKDGTEIPVMVYVDKVNSSEQDIRPSQLPAIGDQAVESIRLFNTVYGKDYPYDELNLVSDPLGFLYGQSPASLIYLGWGVFRGEGTLAQVGGSNLTEFIKDVVAHEVAHQWWGSMMTNSNQRNYWFVESMAEYSSALYVEKAYGRKRYLQKVDEWRRTVMERNVFGNVQNNYAAWNGGTTQALIYNKGPLAMHVLRETFGDEKFFRYLRALAQNLSGKEIVTRDIQLVAEKVYGGNMDWFFDQWIRGVGMPEYRWTHNVRQTEDGQWLIEGKILQRVVVGLKKHIMEGVYYKSAIPIHVEFGGGEKSEQNVFVEGPETTFRIKVPKKPTKVGFASDLEAIAWTTTVGSSWEK